jgi:hypothetical protein
MTQRCRHTKVTEEMAETLAWLIAAKDIMNASDETVAWIRQNRDLAPSRF